jgi:hypothetical protein
MCCGEIVSLALHPCVFDVRKRQTLLYYQLQYALVKELSRIAPRSGLANASACAAASVLNLDKNDPTHCRAALRSLCLLRSIQFGSTIRFDKILNPHIFRLNSVAHCNVRNLACQVALSSQWVRQDSNL